MRRLKNQIRKILSNEGVEKLDEIALREFSSFEGRIALIEVLVQQNGGPYRAVRSALLHGNRVERKKAMKLVQRLGWGGKKIPSDKELSEFFVDLYILAYSDPRNIERILKNGFTSSQRKLFEMRVAADFMKDDLLGTLKRLGLISKEALQKTESRLKRYFSYLFTLGINSAGFYALKLPVWFPGFDFLKGKHIPLAIRKEVTRNGFSDEFYRLMKIHFGKSAGFELFWMDLARLDFMIAMYLITLDEDFRESLVFQGEKLWEAAWTDQIEYHFFGGKERQRAARKEFQKRLNEEANKKIESGDIYEGVVITGDDVSDGLLDILMEDQKKQKEAREKNKNETKED